MVQIHGIAYLVIGVSVITISSWVGERYQFFFYVGFIFVFVGIGKLLYNWMTKEGKPSPHSHSLHGGHHTTQHQGQHHQTHNPRQHQAPHLQRHQSHYKICRRCGTHSSSRAHYCPQCGGRV